VSSADWKKNRILRNLPKSGLFTADREEKGRRRGFGEHAPPASNAGLEHHEEEHATLTPRALRSGLPDARTGHRDGGTPYV
jgi:hypothetical protein